MTQAIPRKDISNQSNLTSQIVRLETATETLMAYIGYLNTEIDLEEVKPSPDQARIEALNDQMKAVWKERRAIRPDNEKLIDRAIFVYAPIVKALYSAK